MTVPFTKKAEAYRLPPGPPKTYRRPQNAHELPLPAPNVIVVPRNRRLMWSPLEDGRQTCLMCKGEGELTIWGETRDCPNCDGEGYRWP